MKRAVLLHGTNGNPSDNWQPWIKAEFEKSGYEVWAPMLPDNDAPNRDTYWNFLMSQGWDFKDNVLVGHSSGATSVLNLLSSNQFPKIKAAVLVGLFLNENLTSKSPDFEQNGQFAHLFPKNSFDWSTIKDKAEKFYVVHGDDDPYCSYEDARQAADTLDAELITVKNGRHLSDESDAKQISQLKRVLRHDQILS